MSGSQQHHPAAWRARNEPALGNLEELPGLEGDARRRTGRAPPPPRSGRRWPWVLLLLLVAAGVAGWSQRDSLRAWLPRTQLTRLLDRADAALAAGKLDGHDGSSARELYAAARALRPDDARAREGLRKVGQAELDQAAAQIKAGELAEAGQSLRVARALLGGGSRLDQLDAELARAQARGEKLETLLDRAAQALADGNVDGARGAAALYQQALVAEPGNAIAKHGMEKVAAAMAASIRGAIRHGRLDDAAAAIARLEKRMPAVSSLPQLRAELAKARRAKADRLSALLAEAEADLKAGRLGGEGEENATARFRQVLADDPGNDQALRGLRAVAQALLQRASRRMDAGQREAAGDDLDQAAALAEGLPGLAQARQRLASLGTAPAAVSAQDKARLASLLTRAQAAADSGHLLLPPGDNAWDLYRSALAIDPDNADAMSGLATLPGLVRQRFDQAVQARDRQRARELMAAYAQLAPGSSVLATMQSRIDTMPADRAGG